MKILMVDDSSADRRLCRTLLEDGLEEGAEPLEFHEEQRAKDALETCRRVIPDCLLLDYRLPDMSGLEFLAKLQGDEPRFAVVMLTGLASEQVAVEAMRAGAQDYLVKDRITSESLAAAVHRATEKIALTTELRDERQRLKASLAEKEVLLKEVHHRVKNNLQIITSLLRLQENADPRVAESIRDSRRRVESMALIHEQLYESNELSGIDLRAYIDTLAANLYHAYGAPPHVSLNVEIEPMQLSVDRAIPCGLILNELISDAFKHAFPEGRRGSVTIRGALAPDHRVTVEVRDDGIGFPAAVDPRKPKSLGLEIVAILTRQLGGSLDVEHGGGTAFRLAFPRN